MNKLEEIRKALEDNSNGYFDERVVSAIMDIITPYLSPEHGITEKEARMWYNEIPYNPNLLEFMIEGKKLGLIIDSHTIHTLAEDQKDPESEGRMKSKMEVVKYVDPIRKLLHFVDDMALLRQKQRCHSLLGEKLIPDAEGYLCEIESEIAELKDKGRRYEQFMIKISTELNCLPSFYDPVNDNKHVFDELEKIKSDFNRHKGSLRTLAKRVAYNSGQSIDAIIIHALAYPSLDEISSKDYGADGVGLTHAEVDKLAEEDK